MCYDFRSDVMIHYYRLRLALRLSFTLTYYIVI